MRDLSSALSGSQLDVRRYQRAIVKTAAANVLTLMLDDTTELTGVPALSSSPTYAVNDIVVLARDATGPFVIGRLGVSSTPAVLAPAAPPVGPTGSLTQRTRTVLPSFTGSYRASGGWRDDDTVRQGDWNSGYGINQGAAFYGSQLKGLGASLSHPRSAVLTYSRLPGGVFGAQTPTLHTLSQAARPAGAPTRLLSAPGAGVAVNRTATHVLSSTMLDQLHRIAAGGLGVYVGTAAPYIVLAGRSSSAVSMSLAVTYYA